MTGKCLIVANPMSGLGFGRRNAPRLAAALRERGCDADLVWTTGPGTARSAAAEASPDRVSVILCVGGDGTLNEVANGIGDRRIPVTVFPTGTGNVLAKEYGIPYNVTGVCDMIVRGHTELLDVGVVNGRRFVLFAGIGFDAAVARFLRRRRTGRISLLNYVVPILRTLAAYDFPEIKATLDGLPAGSASSVLVSNVRSYGGPFRFTAEASPTDGSFDVCLVRGRRRRDLVRYLWAGGRRRVHRLRDVACVRARQVELTSESPVPVQADGDFIGESPVRIDLLPAHLPVIVP